MGSSDFRLVSFLTFQVHFLFEQRKSQVQVHNFTDWSLHIILLLFFFLEEQNVIRNYHKGKSYLTNLVIYHDVITGWVDVERAVNVVYALTSARHLTLSPIKSLL